MTQDSLHNSPPAKRTVTLGLLEVEVDEGTQAEMIEAARRQLSMEWPRLWDIIHSKPDAAFDVKGRV